MTLIIFLFIFYSIYFFSSKIKLFDNNTSTIIFSSLFSLYSLFSLLLFYYFYYFIGPLDLPGCEEFLFESIKIFYIENKTKIERKISTINNELNKEKLDGERDDIKIEVEVEEENGVYVSENDIMILSDRIAEHCVGYTGAELKMVIKKAIKYCYHDTKEKENEIKNFDDNKNENKIENLERESNQNQNKSQHKLLFKHFEKAILEVKRSVTLSDIQEFEKWAKEKK